MSVQDNLIKASHLIDMNDIIREGNPTLRQEGLDVTLPLSDEDIILGEKMLAFLRHSQDPVMAEKLGLRGGVGIAAPQLDISKKIIACLVPKEFETEEAAEMTSDAYRLATIMYNAKIVAHSVQDAALADGEGCLSVDRDVPGYVVRHARVTVEYIDKNGNTQRLKLRGYDAMVVQHEIDHTNGIMFYDRINEANPFAIKEGMLIIE
ncbi:MAG: peptide deformylase [Lactococcus sp.]|nr:peptide deformylase [Lactococcus sp.]